MLCSHLMSAFVSTSTSPSKFNNASMVRQMHSHRMGLNSFSVCNVFVAIDTILNFDSDANTDVKCEQVFTQ